MLKDLLGGLDQHLDSLIYIALVVMLVAVAVHADKRYDEERTRNEKLERRLRSLMLVVRFQDTVLKVDEPAPVDTARVEILDISVDAMIRQLGYCLTCHKLKAPSHFTETDHLRLEDDKLIPDSEERA